MPRLLALCFALLLALAAAPGAHAAFYDVTTQDDEADAGSCTPGDADCSLREAIIAANTNGGADTIRVPAGTYGIEGAGSGAALGDFDITDSVTIERSGDGVVTFDGNEIDRVFDITAPATVSMFDVRVVDGRGELGVEDGEHGGGIRLAGNLTLTRVLMQNNRARKRGGAVAVRGGGNLHAIDSTFRQNDAVKEGGGVYIASTCTLGGDGPTYVRATATFDRSVITGNTVTLDSSTRVGGGIYDQGAALTLRESEVSDNLTEFGGGISTYGACQNSAGQADGKTFTLRNVTVSGNTATGGYGGGVYVLGKQTVTVESSTIANNASAAVPFAAANWWQDSVGGGNVSPTTFTRTLLAQGRSTTGGPVKNCHLQAAPEVTVTSKHSLADDTTCRLTDPTDKPGVSPQLGTLGLNGGPSRTHAIPTASPAIDAGGVGCPATDQRGTGFPRPVGAACDIGAFEGESTGSPDDDGDGFANGSDNCVSVANPTQANADGDAEGDACDADDDGDGVLDGADNCALASNANQANTDGKPDGGDACDADDDDDDVPDSTDNCATAPNPEQEDTNGNGIGNACEPSLQGTVELNNQAVPGAIVSFCAAQLGCRRTETGTGGRYRFQGIPVGKYTFRASFGRNALPAEDEVEILPQGANHDFDLESLNGLPEGTSISGRSFRDGEVPVVHFGEPFDLEQKACVGADVSFELVQGTVVVRRGRMRPAVEDETLYRATVRPLQPAHGYSTVRIDVKDCDSPGGVPDNPQFTLYIDPSGNVRDLKGRPIVDATVRLYRSDLPVGPFGFVPDGDLIMSPANRVNPDKTDASGHFGWDVIPGYYTVRAEKAGCKIPPGGRNTAAYAETRIMEIPPPVLDLDIRLDCPYEPKLVLGALPKGTFAVAKRGTTALRLTNLSPFRITGSLTFRRGRAKVASSRFRLGATRSGSVAVRLSRGARAQMAKGSNLRVTAIVEARGVAKTKASARRAITLRKARSRKHGRTTIAR